MVEQTISVPDGKTAFIYLVDTDKAELAVAALASYSTLKPVAILDEENKPVLDDDGKPVFEILTPNEKAVDYLSKHVGMITNRFQSKQSVLSDQANYKKVIVESLE